VGPRHLNITNIEKRRYRGEAAEDEDEDAIFNLLLKHQNETFATYVRNSRNTYNIFETLVKIPEKRFKKPLQNICNI
jgi:hypothetical protein